MLITIPELKPWVFFAFNLFQNNLLKCIHVITFHRVHKVGQCRVDSVGSVSASHMVGREFASRPGHTKDHHKNGTDCLPA